VSELDYAAYRTRFCNWGRWGANDSKGAVNLITPEKIREAAGLVKTGRAVSLSRPYAPEQQYVRINDRRATTGASSIIDYYGSNYHGVNVTHVDALSHVWDRAGMWNGRDPDKELDTFGPHFADIAAFSSGLITRGVLLDVPRYRQAPFVTVAEPVRGEELEAIAKVAIEHDLFVISDEAYEHLLFDGLEHLPVAADGGRSRLRERAGIAVHGWSYGQSAIVTTLAHERDHHGRAEEHFLPGGPFAILPLRHNRSSIVWTEHSAEAERFVALPDAAFRDELEKRFGLHLGDITLAGPRRAYPLGLWVARSFIAERMALVGDAAHVIHPIAGQGLNMGLRDIAALAEAVVDAARLGLDPGDATVLERYQRWRRFDTMTMSVSTDVLNRLFSNRSDVLRLARDIGLGLVDRLPPLKRMFMREAAGLTGDVPKLLRGEAL
jgi:2-polyprenyl-6-methoxyphenol hydroxylase-like FAD-dependent oxidoreductase